MDDHRNSHSWGEPECPGMPLPGWCWFVGLLVTSAVVWFIFSSGRHARRLEGANTRLDKTLGALNTANDELSAALNNMVLGFVMFDSQGRVAVYNQRYIEMYGLSRDIVKPGCSLIQLLEHRAAIGNLKDRSQAVSRQLSWPICRRERS